MTFRRRRGSTWKVAARIWAGRDALDDIAPLPNTELDSLLERRDKLMYDWQGIHDHINLTLHPQYREAIAVLAAQLESKWSRAYSLTEKIAERFPQAHARYESELYESIFDKMLACRGNTLGGVNCYQNIMIGGMTGCFGRHDSRIVFPWYHVGLPL